MMFSLNFIKGVIHRGQEVFVSMNDGAIQIKFDDRLGFPDRINLPLEIRIAPFLLGNIRGIFNHFIGASVFIDNGIVRGLYPDIMTIFGHPLKLGRQIFTAT